MGRRKGLNYIPLLVSISPGQMNKLGSEKNRSALMRKLLDLYFERWQPLMQEYRGIVNDISSTSSWHTESEMLRLAAKFADPEIAKRFHPPFVAQLRRLLESATANPSETSLYEIVCTDQAVSHQRSGEFLLLECMCLIPLLMKAVELNTTIISKIYK